MNHTRLRSQQREDAADGSVRFRISLNRLATPVEVIAAFSEGYVVGSTLSIDERDWTVTRVVSIRGDINDPWGDMLQFWVCGVPPENTQLKKLETDLQEALAVYESRIKAASRDLVKFCLVNKITADLLDKAVYGERGE